MVSIMGAIEKDVDVITKIDTVHSSGIEKEDNMNDEKEGKRPIVLSLCLMIDILVVGTSFALLLFLAMNMPSEEKTEILEKNNSSRMIIASLRDAKILSLCATFFTWITSMFAGIFTITILFGNKFNLPCCPWMKTQIKSELLDSPPIDKDNVTDV